MKRTSTAFLAVILFLSGSGLFAATFVVPDDRALIRRADAVVIATALDNYSRRSAEGGIETITIFSVTEAIKGSIAGVINVIEPGGTIDGQSTILAGVPRFESGDKALLFLRKTGVDRWAVADLAVGKFSFVSDGRQQLL